MGELVSTNEAVNAQAHQAVVEMGGDAVPFLIKTLKSHDEPSKTRARAAQALAFAGKEAQAAVPWLIKAADESDPILRMQAVFALGRIPNEAGELVPLLIRRLSDAHPRVRYHAALALGRVNSGAKQAVPALRKACSDPDQAVRETARHTLEMLGAEIPDGELSGNGIPPPPANP